MDLGGLAVRHDPASAALVRSALAADLVDSAITRDTVEDIVLVASELVGNAVVHARATLDDDLDVSWDIEIDCVIVRVCDGSNVLPHRRTSTDTDTGGRGLAIVAALSADWGVQRTTHGKQVWARVPLAS